MRALSDRRLSVIAVLSGLSWPGTSAGAEPPPSPASLADVLSREVGAGSAVAVVPGKEGLVATVADGARRRVLVPGFVPWAMVDNRAQVIWFATQSGKDVQVLLLDLTAAGTAPEVIVPRFPDSGSLGVEHVGPKEVLSTKTPSGYRAVLVIDPKKPALKALAGDDADEDAAEGFRGRIRSVKLTPEVVARLKALAARAKGRALQPPREKARLPRVSAVSLERCEEDDVVCGKAEAVPGTPFWIVLVEQTCGDTCSTKSQLYDPRTKEFFDPGDPSRRGRSPLGKMESVGDAWVSPAGDALIRGGRIQRFAGGEISAGGGYGGGWLGGGSYLRP